MMKKKEPFSTPPKCAWLFVSFNIVTPLDTYLLLAEFSVRTVNYGPSFFSIDLWPKRKARGP